MATFNKFDCFVTDKVNGVHDGWLTADTDTVKAFLTNTAPNAATHTAYDGTTGSTGPAEIAAGNGYTAGGEDVQNAQSKTGGTITVTAMDFTITASGGDVGPFRYVVLYNDTSAGNQLIGWYDRGESITLSGTNGDTFTTDFGASLLTET